jgi:hypothetical protein
MYDHNKIHTHTPICTHIHTYTQRTRRAKYDALNPAPGEKLSLCDFQIVLSMSAELQNPGKTISNSLVPCFKIPIY